jgi:hypothetical protein
VTDEEALALLGLPATAGPDDVRAARRRLARTLHPDVTADDGTRMRQVNLAVTHLLKRVPPPAVVNDEVSFSVDRLPAYAFEVLRVTVAALGEVLDTDEPYRMEGWLAEPPVFIDLALVPDAGGSTITVSVDPDEGVSAEEAAAVLVAHL